VGLKDLPVHSRGLLVQFVVPAIAGTAAELVEPLAGLSARMVMWATEDMRTVSLYALVKCKSTRDKLKQMDGRRTTFLLRLLEFLACLFCAN